MRKGFSLVELSIVLVILGLLVGGILAGQSLIRASELRAVGTEYQRYQTALQAFRDKYFAIPGDMANATSFWPTSAVCPSVANTAAAGVCNGDASGQVLNNSANSNEVFGLWEHLAYAGLVEGSYTGSVSVGSTASNTFAALGSNLPRSKLNSGGWALVYQAPVATSASLQYFENAYGNMFFFGSSTGALTDQPILKPEEAWNIDTKLDDGKPATGSIITFESQGGTGTTSCSDLAPSAASMAASNYALANTGAYCSFILKSGV